MELNRWPDKYFAEVEQAAFGRRTSSPASPDRMLQARLFSNPDAVLYRFGVNYYQIPVNAPKCPYMTYHRDGKARVDGNLGGATSFNPNSARSIHARAGRCAAPTCVPEFARLFAGGRFRLLARNPPYESRV